ncbi:MAG: hypothetical protein ACTHK0_07810 [Ginsengibacter sp.]
MFLFVHFSDMRFLLNCFNYLKITCIAALLGFDAMVIPAGAEVIFNGRM